MHLRLLSIEIDFGEIKNDDSNEINGCSDEIKINDGMDLDSITWK